MISELIQPVDLSSDERDTLSLKIAKANAVLRVKAVQRYGDDGSIRQLRYEYVKHVRGKHIFRFDTETRMCLETLMELEATTIAAYMRMAMELSQSFFLSNRRDRPHLDENDYFQEGTWAIFDAVYCYDGSSKFSTYCYHSIKKRLSNFVRSEEMHAGVGRDTKQLRRKVRDVMRQGHSFEDAIEILQDSEEIDEDAIAKVRDSMYSVSYIEKDTFSRPAPKHQHEPDEFDALRQAIMQANLNPIQRELIETFMQTGERIDMDLVRDRINPNTGNPYTRQALSQQWSKACEKLRLVMEQLPVAA